ncbi:hypothetical protein AAOGI_08940 [Agarivorans albus]
MPDNKNVKPGELFKSLPDHAKRDFGRAILGGLKEGRFTFNNPLATEGGDYDQGNGPYTQSGGGTHDQGDGGYNQSKLTNNLGQFDLTDLSQILGSIKDIGR